VSASFQPDPAGTRLYTYSGISIAAHLLTFVLGFAAVLLMGFLTSKLAPDNKFKHIFTQRTIGSLIYTAHPDNEWLDWLLGPLIQLSILQLLGVVVAIVTTWLSAEFWYQHTVDEVWVFNDGQANNVGRTFGALATLWIALSFVPVTKRSIWLSITGCSFERAIKFHRWIGRVAILMVALHAVMMSISYANSHYGIGIAFTVRGDRLTQNVLAGTIGGICYFAIWGLSLIRRTKYEFFRITHFLFAVAVFCTFLHFLGDEGEDDGVEPLLYFILCMLVPVIMYVIDSFMLYSERTSGPAAVSFAEVFSATSSGSGDAKTRVSKYVQLVMSKPNTNVKGGQYVFLHIPELSMVAHPFSICPPPTESPNASFSLVLKTGGPESWTSKLYDCVQNKECPPCYIIGGFGEPSIPHEQYGSLILVAGGIGITPMLSLFDELMRKKHAGAVTLIWCFRDMLLKDKLFAAIDVLNMPSNFTVKLFCTNKEEMKRHNSTSSVDDENSMLIRGDNQEIQLHTLVQRNPSKDQSQTVQPAQDSKLDRSSRKTLPIQALQVEYGRPNTYDLFAKIAQEHSVHTGVMVCGPDKLIHATHKAAERLMKNHPFNVDVHEETFLF
jgi:predicted ferric reductase